MLAEYAIPLQQSNISQKKRAAPGGSQKLRSKRCNVEYANPGLLRSQVNKLSRSSSCEDTVAQRCKCSARDNNHGKGTHQGHEFFFFPDLECPLHGIRAVVQDRSDGERIMAARTSLSGLSGDVR